MTNIFNLRPYSEKSKYGFALFFFTALIFFIDFIINVLRSNINNDMDVISWMFYIPSALAYASLYSFILYILVYFPLSFVFKNSKIASTVYVIFTILLQIIFIIDSLVFSLYQYHLNGNIIGLFITGGSDIFVFDFWLCVKFALLVLLAAVLPCLVALKLCRYTRKMIITRKNMFIGFAIVFSLLVFAHVGYALALAKDKNSVIKSATAIPLFQAKLTTKVLRNWNVVTQDEIGTLLFALPYADMQYPLHPLEFSDSVPNFNIVYILIDSWNPTAYDSICTPNIYRFAKQKGQFFENHYSASNATHASMYTFFYGLPHSYELATNMQNISPLFIDKLLNWDYNIQTFPSAELVQQNIFIKVPDINTQTKGATSFDTDTEITRNAIDYINAQKGDKPFFSFLFYDLAHAISIPAQYRTKFQPSWSESNYLALNNDTDGTPFFNLYKNCIYYVDHLVGEVIQTIEEKGMLDNTVIVITGDHGQEFNENKKNYWGHYGNFSNWQLKVPFVIYYPSIESGKTLSHTTTHYDLSTTMMSRFLGVKNPAEDYSVGRDLYDETSRYPFLSGNYHQTSVIFDSIIVSGDYNWGNSLVTDRQLNDIPRDFVDIKELKKAIDQRSQFLNKENIKIY